jgi:hypothetical protein
VIVLVPQSFGVKISGILTMVAMFTKSIHEFLHGVMKIVEGEFTSIFTSTLNLQCYNKMPVGLDPFLW